MVINPVYFLVLSFCVHCSSVTSGRSFSSQPEPLFKSPLCNCIDYRQCSYLPKSARNLKDRTCGFMGFIPFICCDSSLMTRTNEVPVNIQLQVPLLHPGSTKIKRTYGFYRPAHQFYRHRSPDLNYHILHSIPSIHHYPFQQGSFGHHPPVYHNHHDYHHTEKPNTATRRTPVKPTGFLPNPPFDSSEDISTEKPKIETSTNSTSLLPAAECGKSIDLRIIGGKAAALGQFPWMVRLGYKRNGEGQILYRCGGTLINEKYVLTAAHCVAGLPGRLRLATVRLGELDERSDPDCEATCADPVQDIEPEMVTIHPTYDSPKFQNDIALIRLKASAKLSSYVSPICLPLDSSWVSRNLTDQRVQIAGWGSTSPGGGGSSEVLQTVTLTVRPTESCARAYVKTGVRVSSPGQLCAAGQSREDSCEGDSGGPLMQVVDGDEPQMFLQGLVSFGTKACDSQSLPGVYTRVAAYATWIRDNVKP